MMTEREHWSEDGEHIILVSQDMMKDGLRGNAALRQINCNKTQEAKRYKPRGAIGIWR